MSVEAQKAKQVIIDEIKEKLDGAQSAVVIDYMGITVAQADALRKKLREANVDSLYIKIRSLRELLQELNLKVLLKFSTDLVLLQSARKMLQLRQEY